MGRPSRFTLKTADEICERLADGESLRTICSADTMPNRATVFRWLAANKNFRDQYARAREAQADAMADEILNIADDGENDTYVDDFGKKRTDYDVISRSKLRVDARKWLASKLRPKVYGEASLEPTAMTPEEAAQAAQEAIAAAMATTTASSANGSPSTPVSPPLAR